MVQAGNNISSGGRERRITNSRPGWATGDFKASLGYPGSSLSLKKVIGMWLSGMASICDVLGNG